MHDGDSRHASFIGQNKNLTHHAMLREMYGTSEAVVHVLTANRPECRARIENSKIREEGKSKSIFVTWIWS